MTSPLPDTDSPDVMALAVALDLTRNWYQNLGSLVSFDDYLKEYAKAVKAVYQALNEFRLYPG